MPAAFTFQTEFCSTLTSRKYQYQQKFLPTRPSWTLGVDLLYGFALRLGVDLDQVPAPPLPSHRSGREAAPSLGTRGAPWYVAVVHLLQQNTPVNRLHQEVHLLRQPQSPPPDHRPQEKKDLVS